MGGKERFDREGIGEQEKEREGAIQERQVHTIKGEEQLRR